MRNPFELADWVQHRYGEAAVYGMMAVTVIFFMALGSFLVAHFKNVNYSDATDMFVAGVAGTLGGAIVLGLVALFIYGLFTLGRILVDGILYVVRRTRSSVR